MKAIATYGTHKKYGLVIKLAFQNKSNIYISKMGMTFSIPYSEKLMRLSKKKKVIELTANKQELNLLLRTIDKINKRSKK
jgi:hypothetical protein